MQIDAEVAPATAGMLCLWAVLLELSVGLNHCCSCSCIWLCTCSLFQETAFFLHVYRDACCCGYICFGDFAGAVLDRGICHTQESLCLAQTFPGWYHLFTACCCLHIVCLSCCKLARTHLTADGASVDVTHACTSAPVCSRYILAFASQQAR